MPYDRPLLDFDEETDLKNYKVWIFVLGQPPLAVPFFVSLHGTYGTYGLQYGPETMSDPDTKGWDVRYYRGAAYCTAILTSEEEKKQREPIWRERMRPVLEDPLGWWTTLKNEIKERLEQFFAFDLKGATDIELCEHWTNVISFYKRVQEVHFLPMYAIGKGQILFLKICKELFNISPSDVKYSTLHSGFENEFTIVAEAIAEAAHFCRKLGIEDMFKRFEPAQLLVEMKGDAKGKKFLRKFEQLVEKYGWMRSRGLEIATPSRYEDNTLALKEIKRYLEADRIIWLSESRADLEVKRKELEQELLQKVPKEERGLIERLMRCSQAAHVYIEEHTLYCEMKGLTMIRLAAMEFGRRFVWKGMIDRPDEILFLHSDEILHAGVIQERCNLGPLLKRRKEEHEAYSKEENTLPRFLGDPTKLPELMVDVVLTTNAAPPVAKPEEVGATLVGCAGAPGVVEGIACVVSNEEDFDKIRPGSILVAPVTVASWTPVFGIIKGVVTDLGGYLAHALLVAREFGIPAVVGAQEATRIIKDGQRIRVDGNLLRVYVLED